MFDNRWENWAGDFAETFAAGLLDPSVRSFVPDILAEFGKGVRKIDRDFPDGVSDATFAKVLTETMPRLTLPERARAHVPDVIARFLEYLRESGRVGEGDEWAEQVRALARLYRERLSAGGVVKSQPIEKGKGVTIRKPEGAAAVGRNDPCPCGSGKKFKKCCMGRE